MFALIVLSDQRKFLSRKTCQTPEEAGAYVARMLQEAVVGSLSVQRVSEKQSKAIRVHA